MADKIKVSTGEMIATIGRYHEAQHTMTDAQRSMRGALANLDHCWKGPAWAAMMMKWQQIEANIIKSEMAVNRSIVALRNVVMIEDGAEQNNVATGKGLETGTQAPVYID